jgi:hypothetical protein
MTPNVSLDDRAIGEALAKSGMPIDLIALLTVLGAIGEQPELCDCPPGICLGDQDDFLKALDDYDRLEASVNAAFDLDLARDSGDETDVNDEEDDEDEFEIVFEPDFDFDPIDMASEDKVEAVAQLGRIIEGLTTVVELHATLLKKLVA